MKEKLTEIFRRTLKIEAPIGEIVKLHGDASYRAYYRAKLDDGSSYIVMQMPEGKASVSEEITNFNGTHEELPFINVARYLREKNIPVPAIHCYDEDHHLMILEDLGDDIMARHVEVSNPGTQLQWYKKAIDLLVEIQQATKGDEPQACVALQRSFDATLLNWEFDHFREYGIEAREGAPMKAGDREAFEKETRAITAKIEALPYGFTHRDFQSRNLLIQNGGLRLIDFQDALMGPEVYDLVALLRDSYVRLPDHLVEKLIQRYSDSMRRETRDVRREFDLVTVQRKLKDAGRFVFIDRVKGNPNFLPYIPTSLGYAREALERLPEHKGLYEVLKKYVTEWK